MSQRTHMRNIKVIPMSILSPIYTICFDRHVSKQTKRHIAHTRVYTVCLAELSLNFPSKINSFVYIILTWRKIILLYLHVCW